MKPSFSPREKGSSWKKAAPGLSVLTILVLAGFVLHRPPVTKALAAVPPGWTRTLEPGKALALAFREDSVFVGGRDGLFELERKSGRFIRKVDLGPKPPHIRSLAVGRDGSLWIGHLQGVIHWNDRVLRSWSERDGLPAARVNSVKVSGDSVIIGTSRGLARLQDGSWQVMGESRLLASPVVNCILQASDGALWVGSSSDPKGGLTRLAKGKAQVWTAETGLPHPYVQDLEEMPDGSVWASTGQLQQGGAVCFKTTGDKADITKTETKRSGLAGEKVRSSGVTHDGRLVFGSENDGLAVGDGSKWQVLTVEEGLPHNEVTAIETDSDGILWAATLNGVLRIDPRVEGSLPRSQTTGGPDIQRRRK